MVFIPVSSKMTLFFDILPLCKSKFLSATAEKDVFKFSMIKCQRCDQYPVSLSSLFDLLYFENPIRTQDSNAPILLHKIEIS